MIILGIKLLLVAICGFLYRAGGSDEFPKAVRRIGCPLTILASLILSQNWIGLISVPFIALAVTLGYGVNSKLTGLLKNKYLVRLVCGLAYSVTTLAIFWGSWWAYGFHIVFCTSGVVLAGNQKFQWEDKREEGFIGCLIGLMPIFGR